MQKATTTAQREAIKRTFLQTFDVPGSSLETVIGMSELIPNMASGRESHPGVEAGYVLQGVLTLLVDGKPPLQLKAGQSWKLPARAVHDVRTGAEGAKVIGTWVVEKGKPFASPAH